MTENPRKRTSADERDVRRTDSGFTLLELLVVMIVIGILAGIAIPLFLSQRAKAHDASTKSDVAKVGKEVAAYYVDGTGSGLSLDLTVSPGRAVLSDGTWHSEVSLTNGTAAPTTGAVSNLTSDTGWCVSLTDPRGEVRDFRFSARNGLEPGIC